MRLHAENTVALRGVRFGQEETPPSESASTEAKPKPERAPAPEKLPEPEVTLEQVARLFGTWLNQTAEKAVRDFEAKVNAKPVPEQPPRDPEAQLQELTKQKERGQHYLEQARHLRQEFKEGRLSRTEYVEKLLELDPERYGTLPPSILDKPVESPSSESAPPSDPAKSDSPASEPPTAGPSDTGT